MLEIIAAFIGIKIFIKLLFFMKDVIITIKNDKEAEKQEKLAMQIKNHNTPYYKNTKNKDTFGG